MLTILQAVERHRHLGLLPIDGEIRCKDLIRRYPPPQSSSVRSLISKMFDDVSEKRPWAIILCRFKGSIPDPVLEDPTKKFYNEAFIPGSGGLVEYWRDVSLGAIDIRGSKVFDWVELEITRAEAGGPGVGRLKLTNYAISAAQRKGLDPITGFFNQIAIFTQNWSIDNVPGGTATTPDWNNNDPRAIYWIDGSADWNTGKITLTPPHNGNITAHEMGHTLKMNHDISPGRLQDYTDPCCIMSQQNAFIHPIWNVAFGPALCLPHLMQKGWMYKHRVYYDSGSWMNNDNGIVLHFAPINDVGTKANLGIRLAYNRRGMSWDYYLEYVNPAGWNRGLPQSSLLIRRMGFSGEGETSVTLGSIALPTTLGQTSHFIEAFGNVRFEAERFDNLGKIIRVFAKAL